MFALILAVYQLNLSTANVMIEATKAFNNDSCFTKLNVIDGKLGNFDECCCCFATEGGTTWVRLDLSRRRLVDHLVIYGRSDGKCKL